MMKSVHFFVMGALALGVLIAACVSPDQQAPEMTTVKVAYIPLISNGPLFIAQEEGYFTRQGITVEFEKFQSGPATLPPLINGDIAASGGAINAGLYNAIARGAHVRIVADKGRMAPGFCNSTALVVRRDLFEQGAVRNESDLRGRKVSASADQHFAVSRALARGNLTGDDIEKIDLDYPSAVIALKNGAIDAGILTEPYLTQALNSGAAVVLVPGSVYAPNFPVPLYYGPAFLDKNPELGRRFMIAYLQGVHQYNAGKTERNLEILHIHTRLDKELLKQSCWVPIADDGQVIRQPVIEYMDWLYDKGDISQKINEDQIFDMSYVTYANTIVRNMSPGA
jgi:NitT/TauT family transport system substrate-binding protein